MAEVPPTSVHSEVPAPNPPNVEPKVATKDITLQSAAVPTSLAQAAETTAANQLVPAGPKQPGQEQSASPAQKQQATTDASREKETAPKSSAPNAAVADVVLPPAASTSVSAGLPAASSPGSSATIAKATTSSHSMASGTPGTSSATMSSSVELQEDSSGTPAATAKPNVASDPQAIPASKPSAAEAPVPQALEQPPTQSGPVPSLQAPPPSAPQSAPTDALQDTRAALQRQDFPAATRSVEAYLTNFPQDPEAWLLLGQVHFECGSHADALAAYSKAMELSPGDYRVWLNIGELYSACEQHQDAYTAYTHALSLPGVDIQKLQQRLEMTQANIRAQDENEARSNEARAPSQTHSADSAADATPAPATSTAPPAPPVEAPKPHIAKPTPVVTTRPEPQRSTGPTPSALGGAGQEEAAYTVIPPRLQAGNYESSRGQSSFSTMGGATVHNPRQSIPPARVQVTTGAGNMGKFTCLTAPLSTLQEHTVPSQLQQTPTLQELLQDIPQALQRAQGLPQGDPSLQLPVMKGGTIWLLPVSVLRLWFLLAISDHSRHTAHKLYPDQHPPPPGLPPIHYNLLSADSQPTNAGMQPDHHHHHQPPPPMAPHGGVKRPREAHMQASGPVVHEEPAQMYPGASPNIAAHMQGDGGVTVSQARAMFGARFPNRMRGKKGIRLMGVPAPSKNTSSEQEDREQAAAIHSLAGCLGTSAVSTPLLNSACSLLSVTKPTQGKTPSAEAPLPQWAQNIVQHVQPAVAGVEMRLMPNERPGADASHRIVLRLPAWPYKRRVHRRDARLSRLLQAGAQDVQPDDEIGSVDTVIDENDERLVPVQPVQTQQAPRKAGGPLPPSAPGGMGAQRPASQQHPPMGAQPGQGGWGGPQGMDPAAMAMTGPQGDVKPQGQPMVSARDFMQPGASGGMHPQMAHGMPHGSGGMDMHHMQGHGMPTGAEAMYGGGQGPHGQYPHQGGAPPGMHPGMGMPPGAYPDHGQHQQYPPSNNQGHMQGQPYGSQAPPGVGYPGDDRGMQQMHMRGPGGMPPAQGYGMYQGQGPPMQQGPEGGYGGFSSGMPTPYHGHAAPPQGHAPPPHGYNMPPGGQYFDQSAGGAPAYGGQGGQGYPPGQQQGYGAPPQHYGGQFQYYR